MNKHTARRLAITVLLLISMTLPAFAAKLVSVSLEPAFSLNGLITTTGYREDTWYKVSGDLGFNLAVDFNINKYVGLETGLRYIPKGWVYQHDYESETRIYSNYSFKQLEVPFLIVANVPAGDFTFSFGAGGYFGYLVSGSVSGSFIGLSYTNTFDDYVNEYSNEKVDLSTYNRFVYGVIAQFGIFCTITEHVDLYMKAAYEYQFTPLELTYQKTQTNAYHSTFIFSMGVRMNFGGEV